MEEEIRNAKIRGQFNLRDGGVVGEERYGAKAGHRSNCEIFIGRVSF